MNISCSSIQHTVPLGPDPITGAKSEKLNATPVSPPLPITKVIFHRGDIYYYARTRGTFDMNISCSSIQHTVPLGPDPITGAKSEKLNATPVSPPLPITKVIFHRGDIYYYARTRGTFDMNISCSSIQHTVPLGPDPTTGAKSEKLNATIVSPPKYNRDHESFAIYPTSSIHHPTRKREWKHDSKTRKRKGNLTPNK